MRYLESTFFATWSVQKSTGEENVDDDDVKELIKTMIKLLFYLIDYYVKLLSNFLSLNYHI